MQHILIPINHEVTNYVDDFAGGDDDPDIPFRSARSLEEYLALCYKYSIKLSRKKVRVRHDTLEALD